LLIYRAHVISTLLFSHKKPSTYPQAEGFYFLGEENMKTMFSQLYLVQGSQGKSPLGELLFVPAVLI
jgi:hypothetical protein